MDGRKDEYKFVMDRFLADQPTDDDLQNTVEDDEAVIYRNCSMRGGRLPAFKSLKLPLHAMAKQNILPEHSTEREIKPSNASNTKPHCESEYQVKPRGLSSKKQGSKSVGRGRARVIQERLVSAQVSASSASSSLDDSDSSNKVRKVKKGFGDYRFGRETNVESSDHWEVSVELSVDEKKLRRRAQSVNDLIKLRPNYTKTPHRRKRSPLAKTGSVVDPKTLVDKSEPADTQDQGRLTIHNLPVTTDLSFVEDMLDNYGKVLNIEEEIKGQIKILRVIMNEKEYRDWAVKCLDGTEGVLTDFGTFLQVTAD